SIAQGKDTDIKDLIKQAEESYSNYDYKNAIHYLDKALEINPTHYEAKFLKNKFLEEINKKRK
ncbi:MAG: hypothetical protein U0586_15695, partial [Candidatus Brocadiaceae bacterium]